jgi:protein-S-isoprenylcysteine O-methyltransferase Ste14
MALSKAEQELLAQLESSLAAEDPKLAQKLASAPIRRVHPRRATLGVVGLLLGIAALVAGMMIGNAVGIGLAVIGFIIMLAAAVFFLTAWQARPESPSAPRKGPPPTAPAAPADFMSRLEQRWRERQGHD